MARTRKAKAPAPIVGTRPARNKWQTKRDEALRKAGFTKADVHRALVALMRKEAPSVAGVRAVLDGRYRDGAVAYQFVAMVSPETPVGKRAELVEKFFPVDEPAYKG